MNSWKLNGQAGHLARVAICRGLNIPHNEIYRQIKSINSTGVITDKEGKRYMLELREI